MKRFILALALLLPSVAFAAGYSGPLDRANYDLRDKESLQRGAQIYMNYCLACHSMQYQRYSRTFNDLGIPQELGEELLQFTSSPGMHKTSAIDADAAAEWFGLTPPDLTMVARVRGADWIYTYLRSFYADDSRPFGANNAIFDNVGMPHVLEELQGTPRRVTEQRMVDGEMTDVYVGIRSDGNGTMSPEEFDQAMLDLTNFLVYTGEPMILERQRMGYFVIGFLIVFLILAILLKKEYWRDIK
ncbi:cytochrome c1 [Aliidiomarina maris]|uniref:Cytochrome c1 n=1 Tax=Aliidiomarina maris TaxID=531312 RepID=A0ABY0BUU5_9GAMM|nr:cytochrome c1 [Aliidiomarina maris]MBA3987597.1 cytochrome c1 [Idiomarina sp.]MCL5050563.1 cytochrome c1 [Bacillota bacterium]RUO27831.1 cytochrome c1 [Aliidiomarina maris]